MYLIGLSPPYQLLELEVELEVARARVAKFDPPGY